MLARRAASALLRQARPRTPSVIRSFSTTIIRREERGKDGIITSRAPIDASKLKTFHGKLNQQRAVASCRNILTCRVEIESDEDLMPPGAPVGTIPTELNQATGLERLEILAKMEGIDIWDMRPLDSSRKGTMENPVIVKSYGDEHYVGCTGVPADTHDHNWMTLTRDRPIERCTYCGNVIKMEYTGPEDPYRIVSIVPAMSNMLTYSSVDGHPPEKFEPVSLADFIKPEYYYK